MRDRPLVVWGVVVLGLVVLVLLDLPTIMGLDDAARQDRDASSGSAARRDFMFQVDGYKAEGQTINMYFHYRYDRGIAQSDIPDFRDLRTDAMKYMKDNASEGVYWETLSKGVCTELKAKYPVEAISCQLQIYPGRDPGFSSSIHTLGDIEPLAVPAPIGAARSPDN